MMSFWTDAPKCPVGLPDPDGMRATGLSTGSELGVAKDICEGQERLFDR
jgi:hypothetical protein